MTGYRLLTLFCVLGLVFGQASHADVHPEQRLVQALDALQSANLDQAEVLLKALIDDEPEFKLAQMLYADSLKARANPLYVAGKGLPDIASRQPLLSEIKTRWQARQTVDQTDKIPAVIGRLDENYLHAIVVDLSQSRLFVFENDNGRPRQVADYYVSMGRGGPKKEKQGDLRTPLGVYFVQSHIPPQKLADKYGSGAYPINYPNAWDNYQGRTGYGIWLHGTRSGTYNRPPLASEGCVVLPNNDLLEVGNYISLGQTPVLIGYDLEWLSVEQWRVNQQPVTALFTQWLNDWQSLNTDAYLSHYSKHFSNGKKDFQHWSTHKKRVAQYKTFVEVEATDVSLLKHPNEDVLVATFHQRYRSDNFVSQSWKRQYWHKEEDGQWRIIFEGEISPPSGLRLTMK